MTTFDYAQYFREVIQPKDLMGVYNRFIFAFTSVHTTWQNNIAGYQLLKDRYHTDPLILRPLIIQSGMGLHNNRTKYITKFTREFQENPKWYLKTTDESWQEYATRLEKNILGLGYAKIRFSIEMLYPNDAEIVCTDTHVIQSAGFKPDKMTKSKHKQVEQIFLERAKEAGMGPVHYRWMTWDKIQKQPDSRFWSFVFEC